MTTTSCSICNRSIEPSLASQGKTQCFVCLTNEVVKQGALPVFALKQKPIEASCAICGVLTAGPQLMPSPWGYICNSCVAICSERSGVEWSGVVAATSREWLVRSAGRVVGPFNAEEVEEQIRDNRISPLDEVGRTLKFWKLVRDEDHFRLAVNEIKNRKHSRVGEVTATSGLTGTDVITQTSDLDLTMVSPERLLDGVEIKKAVVDVKPATVDASHSTATESRDLIKTYGAASDRTVRREIREATNRKIWMALGVFVLAGAFALFKFGGTGGANPGARARAFQDLVEAGLRAEKVGDLNKAYQSFTEAKNLKPNDSELLLHLAPLTFTIDRQMTQAQRMFIQIIEGEQGVNYKKAGYLGLGLIALESHELENAKEKFIRALSIDPEYLPALANLGVVAFLQGDLTLAESSLFKALDRGCTDGAVVLTMADVQITRAGKNESLEKLEAARVLLEKFLQVSQDYTQEINLQLARVQALLGHEKEAIDKIDAFLNIDPEQPETHSREWGYYRGRASWGQLSENLKKTVAIVGTRPRMMAASGLAMYYGKEKLEGAQIISQALGQAHQDSILQAISGWVSIKLGKRDEGRALIKEAVLSSPKEALPFILMARQCFEDGDLECAKKNWDIVLTKNAQSVAALVGMAQIEWAKKSTEGANRWLRQAQALDPTYIPVLVLSQELGGSTP